MSVLSEKIADEHDVTVRVQETRSGWRQPVRVSTVYDCRCGPVGLGLDGIAQHLIDVTERAVRDTIAQRLEDLEFTHTQAKQLVRDGWPVEWTAGHDHAIYKAAALTREGTRDA